MMASGMLRGGMAALAVCAVIGMVGCNVDGTSSEKKKDGEKAAARTAVASVAASAPASVPAVPVLNVAVYDSRSVLQRSPLLKVMFDEVSLRFGQREKELKVLFENVRKKAAELESSKGTTKMDRKVRDEAKAKNQKLGKELTAKHNALLKEAGEFRGMLAKQADAFLVRALGAVVQKRNPMIVHDVAAGRVAYYRRDIDITEEVLANLNALWKASGQKFDLSKMKASKE